MGLNIKNEETYRLTQELSRLTGESLTTAVTLAVKERLERVKRESGREERIARWLELGRDCASRLGEPWLSVDHGELLYGEDGLPR